MVYIIRSYVGTLDSVSCRDNPYIVSLTQFTLCRQPYLNYIGILLIYTWTKLLDFKSRLKVRLVCWWVMFGILFQCLATIATVYWRSNEESVQGERLKGYSRSRELTESSRADRVQAAGKPGSAAPTHTIALYLPLLCVIIHISQHKYNS